MISYHLKNEFWNKGDICDEIRSKVAAVSSFVILRFSLSFSNSFFPHNNYKLGRYPGTDLTHFFFVISIKFWLIGFFSFHLFIKNTYKIVIFHAFPFPQKGRSSTTLLLYFAEIWTLTIFLYVFIRLHWMSTIFPKDMIF